MHRPGRVAVAAIALLGALSGCTTASQPSPTHAPSLAAVTHTPRSTAAHRAAPDPAPVPGSLHTPATTAGSLSVRSFPTPHALGPGWRYAVDKGSAEDGYLGNGTPALARDPAEVVAAAVPLGCPRPVPLTTPRHVLEVDYTHHGSKVVALRSRFPSGRQARAFYAARALDIAACRGRSSGPGIGVLVRSVVRLPTGVLVSDRTPQSDPWSEVALVDGDTVVLLAEHGGRRSSVVNPAQARHIAEVFRS